MIRAAASPANLLAKLDAGGRVTDKQLKQALTESQWEAHCQTVEFEKWRWADQKAASEELSDYTKLLKIADMRSGLFEKQNRKASNRYNIKNSDSLYEKALERLEELLAANPRLSVHLDREYDADTPYGECSAGQMGVPRLKHHSRHVYEKVEHRENPTRTELVRNTLLNAVAESQQDQNQTQKADKAEEHAISRVELDNLRRWMRR